MTESKTETQPDALPEGVTLDRLVYLLMGVANRKHPSSELRTEARELLALLQPKPPVDPLDEIIWHVEQICGPLCRLDSVEVPGDDPYNVLRTNIAAVLDGLTIKDAGK